MYCGFETPGVIFVVPWAGVNAGSKHILRVFVLENEWTQELGFIFKYSFTFG